MVKAALEKSGLSPHELTLKSPIVFSFRTRLPPLRRDELRAMGVMSRSTTRNRLFLAQLPAQFPVDKIKIDRSFIQDLSNGAEPLAIVNAVAGLANAWG